MKVFEFDSVIGFDFNLQLIDRDGELVKTGVKRGYVAELQELPQIGNNFGNTRWFTNFNEALLAKIRDYKRLNT
jgi:hypothetical protein